MNSSSDLCLYRRARVRIVVLLCILVVACSPVRGCVESSFELAPESRLPDWLNVPSDMPREAVTLRISNYVPFSDMIDNTVLVVTIAGELREFTAKHWWHPRTQRQLDAYYETEPRPKFPHPTYVVIEVEGQIDVIEHRAPREQNREPLKSLFWMATDPVILKEAHESIRQGK